MLPGGANVRHQASVYHRLNTNWRHEEIGVDDILLPSRRVFKYVISNHVELMTIPNDRFIIHSVVETSTECCSHGGKELFQPCEEFVPVVGKVCISAQQLWVKSDDGFGLIVLFPAGGCSSLPAFPPFSDSDGEDGKKKDGDGDVCNGFRCRDTCRMEIEHHRVLSRFHVQRPEDVIDTSRLNGLSVDGGSPSGIINLREDHDASIG